MPVVRIVEENTLLVGWSATAAGNSPMPKPMLCAINTIQLTTDTTRQNVLSESVQMSDFTPP